MSRDIEADYREDYSNEEKRCPFCSSYKEGYCNELEISVPLTAHCDFFSSNE
jgi:hypothetical protein